MKNQKMIIAIIILLIIILGIVIVIINIDSIKESLGINLDDNTDKASESDISLTDDENLEVEKYEDLIDTYFTAFSDLDADTLIDIIDFKGYDWKLDISTFEETYNSVSDEDATSYQNEFKEYIAYCQSYYDYYGYSDQLELVSINGIEETDVYGLVKVEISMIENLTQNGKTETYNYQMCIYIYNNKIIALDNIEDSESDENN